MNNILKSVTILITFILLITPQVWAENKSQFSGSVLWKVSGKDLNKPSYILGTHHLVKPHFLDSLPGLKEAMEKTTQIIGEVDFRNMDRAMEKIQGEALLKGKISYANTLSEEEYNQLDENLIHILGTGLENLGSIKPGFINIMIAIVLYTKTDTTFDPQTHLPIDIHLQKQALEAGKPIIGLEEVEDQIYAMLYAAPIEQQIKDLLCQTHPMEVSNAIEEMHQLNANYHKGDLTAIYDMLNDPDASCPIGLQQKNALVKDRNDKWLAQLPQVMKDNPSLIAVGALHLSGREGLLYQLHKMGYTIETL